NKSLLAKFREKDAVWHRKYRQIINKHPATLEKLCEQNRKHQAKRRLKLRSQKTNPAKAVHRSKRSLSASPTEKKEIT
ncbi:unnamed protein product, partial [Rotaria sp. Silwood2]